MCRKDYERMELKMTLQEDLQLHNQVCAFLDINNFFPGDCWFTCDGGSVRSLVFAKDSTTLDEYCQKASVGLVNCKTGMPHKEWKLTFSGVWVLPWVIEEIFKWFAKHRMTVVVKHKPNGEAEMTVETTCGIIPPTVVGQNQNRVLCELFVATQLAIARFTSNA